MKILYKLLFVPLVFFSTTIIAQNIWSDTQESSLKKANQKRTIQPSKFRSIIADTVQLKQQLQSSPLEFSEKSKSQPTIISLPMPDGGTAKFKVVESPIQAPELAAKFPNIKTYSVQGIDDPTAVGKLDWTDFGFHAVVTSPTYGSVYIDPYSRGDKTGYMSYNRNALPVKTFNELEVLDPENYGAKINNAAKATAGPTIGAQLRSYRLAIACTGEYAAAVGGTTASLLHSAIVTTVNRVDAVYETEVAVRLVLVANNNLVEFMTTGVPFTGNSDANTLINESQTVIDQYIGFSNYDIGHTFSTGGGGLAQLGCVCGGSKARGITGSPSPIGDAYDIDYVAHEMGHQFGGPHTFNATTDNCGGGNRNATTAVEPGSGVTIMGYAGICGTNNLAGNSIPYFHTISTNNIYTFITGTGNSCATIINTGNSAPVVNAGVAYTIPRTTPFVLTGSATDPNGDALTYQWEEIDIATVAGNWNANIKPFFRSFSPTVTPTRYFPQLASLATGANVIGEFIPTGAQILNFRLTARDNKYGGGGVASSDVAITVSTAGGPFSLSSQTTATSWSGNGSNTATITWNVASTTAAPFNAANVAILFSADGGLTFPYTLSASTANDGSEVITIPSINTSKGRVMVKALGNIFFNINSANITVTAVSCSAEGAVVSPATGITAAAGNGALNLGLSPQYSAPFSIGGAITSTSPASTLSVYSTTTSGCLSASNVFKYDTYNFVPSVTGSYVFTLAASPSGLIENIYSGAFNPSSPCTGFLASSGTYNGATVTIGNTATASLVAGNAYSIAIGTFSATTPSSLPSNYTVSVASTPAGGVLYSGSGIYADPGTGFSYKYVIVDNATNNIKAISATANLTNATTYPNNTSYTVYGISYSSTNEATLSGYVGGSFVTLSNAIVANSATFCANLSKNSVTVSVNTTLPVSFLGLKARKENKTVALTWSTATEINTNNFIVERSANGVEFNTEIGKVAAAGTSADVKNYSLVDARPLTQMNYYRVKAIDKDGKVTYSNTAAINFEKELSVTTVYPNPAKSNITVEFNSTKAGRTQLLIVDGKGAVVLSKNVNMTLGTNINTLNIASLSNGVYMLKCIDVEGNVSFVKFIKE